MELTGERPMEGSTPDSLIALHDAGYREVLARLGPGSVLDVGCGVGSETARLAAPDRRVVGIDYHAETALLAGRTYGPGGTAGSDVEFAGMDGAKLGFQTASFDWVCSSHIIEHFVGPEQHVAELARVCRDDGTVFVITPNRPADFENPFHVYLFEADELASMLHLFFREVEILGLEGDEELKADFAAAPDHRRPPPEARRLQPAPADAPELVRVELRAHPARRLQDPGYREERRRLRPRPHPLLDERRRRPHHPGALRGRPPAPPLSRSTDAPHAGFGPPAGRKLAATPSLGCGDALVGATGGRHPLC